MKTTLFLSPHSRARSLQALTCFFLVACGDDGTTETAVDSGSSEAQTAEETAATDPSDAAVACDDATCGPNGTCSTASAECDCDPGYAGQTCDECAEGYHTSAGSCEADETCSAASCPEHSECDDSSGLVVCSCTDGYTGDTCAECAAGYHDEEGECVADESCLETTCSSGGTCDDTAGAPVCECAEGYAGARCDECAEGYHADEDLCVEDEQCQSDSCSEHGSCDDATGRVACSCDAGYTGPNCSECEPGLARSSAGECVSDCEGELVPLADGGFACDACEPGYAGADCEECAEGHHAVADSCVVDAECDAESCSGQGACDDTGGVIVCSCDPGFTGEDCSECESGLLPGSNGCTPSADTCEADSCSLSGSCDDSTGTIECACDEGYAGAQCERCATDYVRDDAACVPLDVGDECTADTCSGHGTCEDSSGAAVCTCDDTWAGVACQACADGFIEDGTGTCVPSVCGDGTIDPNLGEDCDDGNAQTENCPYRTIRTSCTTCNYLCKTGSGSVRYCGDSRLQSAFETCDDGEDNGAYALDEASAHCGSNCTGVAPYCGDGNVDGFFGETCDDGTDPGTGNSNSRADACRTTCRQAACGDLVVDTGEDCDDGLGGACPDDCLIPIPDAGAPDAGPEQLGCEESLTQSSDLVTILSNNSVSCNGGNGEPHEDNGYARAFPLETLGIDSFAVTQVRFGVEDASTDAATQPVVVSIYRSTAFPPQSGNTTLIASTEFALADMALQQVTVPIAATVPGGAGIYLVADVYTPNGATSNSRFFIGSNNAGESADGYLRSVACGLSEWRTLTSIGFPGMDLLIHVDGYATGAICEPDAGAP